MARGFFLFMWNGNGLRKERNINYEHAVLYAYEYGTRASVQLL